MAKALWCVLYSKPEGWIFYWSEISKNFSEGREALMNARKKLEEAGYIKITQKRVPTGRGNETKYGGMDIELFHTPSLPIDLDPQDLSQTTGFPTSGFQSSGFQTSGDAISGKQQLKNTKKEKDLSYSSSNHPPKEFFDEIWKKKNFKSDLGLFLENRKLAGWKNGKQKIVDFELDAQRWEDGYLKKNPTVSKTENAEDPEIKKTRYEIEKAIPLVFDYDQYFAGQEIEKTEDGYKIKVSDKRALQYEEILKKINVKIEVK